MADSKASTADQHAVDAGNRAQQAQQTAEQTGQKLQSVEQVVTNIDQYKPATQVELMFRAGQVVLTQKAKTALDELAQNLNNQRGYIVEVQGFSSGRGVAAVQNSQRMADAVVRYLVLNHEVPVYRIYTLGMGNAPVPVSATTNNAAAAAYRTGLQQIVPSTPGRASGAIVAPILAPDGCIGALSAEIRAGSERSEGIQALVTIVAAQLAGLFAATASSADPLPRQSAQA